MKFPTQQRLLRFSLAWDPAELHWAISFLPELCQLLWSCKYLKAAEVLFNPRSHSGHSFPRNESTVGMPAEMS